LLVSGLQQRLLSSIEAFAKTLKVHRKTMERLWAGELTRAETVTQSPRRSLDWLTESPDADDDFNLQSEDEQERETEAAIIEATLATAGYPEPHGIAREKELLAWMEDVAHFARSLPDARVRFLIEWLRENLCPGIRLPGQSSPQPGAAWSDLRVLIFTEYEDTKRYLVNLLRFAMEGTELAEYRLEVFHGPTPPDKREAIKRAFNQSPAEHPLRILVATDAAREGLNLQAHCWNLFHFDVPWNPARLEQRNGRIDRKLQPSPEVFCHYFVYTQRPEDRVLQALVRKTDIIRKELGSLAPVISTRLAAVLKGGIRRGRAEQMAEEIAALGMDKDMQTTVEEELESTRERQDALRSQIDSLRVRINEARRWIGLDHEHFREALSCSLELLGAQPLRKAETPPGQPERYEFPNLDNRRGADPTWAGTLDTLRMLPNDGRRSFEWRKSSPIRPVVFSAPEGIDDDIVQLHLEHRVVQRLLGRFLSQGFVHHDLSRACLAQSEDAIPRVVMLGRLALYGPGAVRLHEELLTVTARWQEPARRKQGLLPYGRDTEARTLELLERALLPQASGHAIAEPVQRQLQASLPMDIGQLLPHLEARGQQARTEAEQRLADRGRIEAESLRNILEDQRKRVAEALGKPIQMTIDFDDALPEEIRQAESNRRYWERWLQGVDADLKREPERIMDFYRVVSTRIEPVGIAYLWPITG
ncbi:MAG: helicase-related protein, partial [Candidatus Methylumidiphilus sp.]